MLRRRHLHHYDDNVTQWRATTSQDPAAAAAAGRWDIWPATVHLPPDLTLTLTQPQRA